MNLFKKGRSAGFTIVELIIVITVIAVLSTIVIVNYTGVRERANATAIYDAIKKVEDGFRLQMLDSGSTTWPRDNTLTGSNNPVISDVAQQGALKGYIPDKLSGVGGSTTWTYDNDGDTTTNDTVCASASSYDWFAVILVVYGVNKRTVSYLDDMIDNGDGPDCGRLRTTDSAQTGIIYQLSWTQKRG